MTTKILAHAFVVSLALGIGAVHAQQCGDPDPSNIVLDDADIYDVSGDTLITVIANPFPDNSLIGFYLVIMPNPDLPPEFHRIIANEHFAQNNISTFTVENDIEGGGNWWFFYEASFFDIVGFIPCEDCEIDDDCDDGDECTADVCDEDEQFCVYTPINCDDGLFCNGVETCVAGNCQAGTPVDCDDGVACTDDSCNEATDSCDNVANDANCDDGLFCNGVETCDAANDCQAGTDPCPGGCDEVNDVCLGGPVVWMSFKSNTSVPGVGTVRDEDIVEYDVDSDSWSLIFDGSDVGLGGEDINAVTLLASGDILLSLDSAATISGLVGGPSGDTVQDTDIVMFTPTSLGSSTAGTFSFYFDGSDVGLGSKGEDIDVITLADDGRLIISTTGGFSGTGANGADEDLFLFTDTSLGANTSGSFAKYFDGSDVGLANSGSEDVDAGDETVAGDILFSTVGSFSVSGLSGEDEDIAQFTPTSLGSSTSGSFSMFLDLSAIGIDVSEDVDAIDLLE